MSFNTGGGMVLFHDFSVRDWMLFAGNICMVITGIFYITWWTSAFKPDSSAPSSVTSAFLMGTIGAGFAWLILFGLGIAAPVPHAAAFPQWLIPVCAAAAYIVLLELSIHVFKRQTTSELFIMLLWAMGELWAVFSLYAAGRFSIPSVVILSLLILLATAAGYICYLKYYTLEGMDSFIDGVIPLAADSCIAVTILIVQAL